MHEASSATSASDNGSVTRSRFSLVGPGGYPRAYCDCEIAQGIMVPSTHGISMSSVLITSAYYSLSRVVWVFDICLSTSSASHYRSCLLTETMSHIKYHGTRRPSMRTRDYLDHQATRSSRPSVRQQQDRPRGPMSSLVSVPRRNLPLSPAEPLLPRLRSSNSILRVLLRWLKLFWSAS